MILHENSIQGFSLSSKNFQIMPACQNSFGHGMFFLMIATWTKLLMSYLYMNQFN